MDFFTYGRNCCQKLICPYDRALPDISSGWEVGQIFNIQTVLKPDVFLPRYQTFKNRKKSNVFFNFQYFFHLFFQNFQFLFVYLFGRMFKYISPDSVRSGRTCPANLGVWSCPVRKLSPVLSSPTIWGFSLNPMNAFYLHCLKWFVWYLHITSEMYYLGSNLGLMWVDQIW